MIINGFISINICDDFDVIIKCGHSENHDTYDAYLEHKDYSIIKHCFGVCQKDIELYDFIKACKEMMWHSYIEDYFDTLEKLENGDNKNDI